MIKIESQNYNEQTSYNKLTLRFYSSKLQLAFKDANIQSFIQNGRIALIVSISIYLLFGLTDFFIISDIFKEAIIIRFSIGAIMGIGSLILSYFNLFYKFGDKIIGFTVLMAGSSILYMIIASNSPLKNYYYFGFYIVVLVSNVFFRQSFLSCLLWSILFSFAFEFTTYITLGLSYLNLLNHWYFYSALLMLLVNSYNSEKHRINEFLLNREIEWHNYNLRDINNELDQLVAKKTEELQIAYENEKKASLLQHTFLMNISHQTRTPLNSIIGISEKWYQGENNTCSIEDLSRINESGKELLRIIDEIALYSKIEADSLTIKHEEFSLCSLLTRLQRFYKGINKKEIDLIIAPSLENDYLLVSDSQKIFTILQSLLFTAYKRSYKGSIIITYEIRDNEKIIFMVTDEGHPLPKNFAKDILSSNWIENTKKVYSESFGISLTNKLSSFFGSGFNITQQEDGTSISFEVKAKILKRKGQSLPKASQDSINLTDCRILIVEDIKINYIILKRILQKKGAKIEWAIDGQEAIEKVTKSMYDIILMDIQMPNMNGIEATQKIRKLGLHTPIIAQTANILADDKDICLEAGCDDYIGKPINALDLIDKVASYVKS